MSTTSTPAPTTPASAFDRVPGYLAACTAGLPTRETVTAMRAGIDIWASGRLDASEAGAQLERCRAHFATIAGVDVDRVATGSQASQLVSIVATAVPDGAEVLCVAQDFASLTHPFEQLRARGVRVRYAPLEGLAEAIGPQTALVAFSVVQSATGAVADTAAICAAATKVGALTLADLTQSLGWLPIGAAAFDFTVCHAYKWLCAPRGVAFMTVRAGLEDRLTPLAAGWYSADDVWSSCYAGHTPLAAGAGRFDVSPAWQAVAGAEPALRLFAGFDPRAAHAHALELSHAASDALGLERCDSAILTWADPSGADLAAMRAHGIVASGRAGNARVAFHLWNTRDDVDMLARAVRR